MAVYRVPIRVSVAPVQTYQKTITVEAVSRREAASMIRQNSGGTTNTLLQDAIHSPGWRSVGGRLGPIRPDHTVYETYLAEDDLDSWVSALPAAAPGTEKPSGFGVDPQQPTDQKARHDR